MDLRKRLARLDRLTRRDPAAEPLRPGPAAVRGGASDDAEVRRVLERELGLALRATPEGDCWWRETDHPETPAPTGPVPDFGGLLPAGTPPDLSWHEVLFLDTETTGLAGGTGTLPFLVGLGWWDDDHLRVLQLFLPGPGREAPLLARLTELARRFRVIATYNGAAFDLPILRTRALLARTEDPCAHLVGWDLLAAARRLWSRRLDDCRQQTIERHLTGLERGPGDIDGALIPAAYAAFVREGEPGVLPDVLRHNQRDMIGMARILAAAAAAAEATQAGPGAWAGSWQDAWCRALIGERRRATELAADWARCLADAPVVDELPLPAVRDAIRLLKRVNDWPRVEALIRSGLVRWPGERRLHYEAAVHCEHRLGDLRRALAHAEQLAEPHRLQRLRRRLARS